MKVGFTGTQKGITSVREESLKRVAIGLRSVDGTRDEWHHGDCVGADERSHYVARWAGFSIIGHPPDDPKKRAFCKFEELRPEKPYIERNHDMVDETDCLVACPGTFEEEQRSGTWATIRYARKVGKPVTIIWPDGTVE